MKSYEMFTKTCVGYRFGDLKIPRIIKPVAMDMPYTSAIHFVSDSVNLLYPDEKTVKQYVKGGIRYLVNITELNKFDNVLGKTGTTMSALISKSKRDVNYLKPCINAVKAQSNETSVLFYNYGLLNPVYKYAKKISTPYYRWSNIRNTLWYNVNKAIEETGAVQIIPFTVPEVVPNYEEYLKIDKLPVIPIPRLKNWSSEEVLDIQDIVRFFGNNRKYSNLNLIKPENYSKVILCFRLINGCSVYYNLGDLDGYIKKDATKEDEENYDEKSNGTLPPLVMQKRILSIVRFLINYNQKILSEIGDEVETPEETQAIEKDKETDSPETSDEQKKVETIAERIKRLREEKNLKKAMEDKIKAEKEEDAYIDKHEDKIIYDTLKDGNNDEFLDSFKDKDDDFFSTLLNDEEEEDEDERVLLNKLNKVTSGTTVQEEDVDLAEENEIASDDELNFNDKTIANLPTPKDNSSIIINTNVNDVEKGVVEKALTLMRKGVITGNEASRMAKLATSYKKIPSPFKTGETLETFSTLNMEELSDLKPAVVPDLLTVPNKALLESKLPNFEKVYIEKYLDKQIAQVTLNALQKSGFAVTGYNVDTIKNASDEYQHITVSVVAPLGTSSDLHFKVPIIRKDGTYKSNGSIFRLRNQRVDVPIRKTKADEVGLSSYYGKLYLNRGRKQSNNFDIKLYQAIKKAKNNEDSQVKINYTDGDVFKIGKTYCRDYSGLSKYLVNLTLDDKYYLVFDQDKLKEEYIEAGINNTSEGFAVGYNLETKEIITMEQDGNMSCGNESLGTIGQYIGINEGKLPKDQAYVEIFGTSIPVGLILSYYYGLHELLNVTGINYDISTKRVTPTRDLSVIKFADCYLSFDANHKSAPIFNSLNACAKVFKDKLFMEFENQDNYNRIFTQCGFNVGHLNEIANLPTLFIDSITEARLVKMNEPKEFKPLLIRAAEMLKDDYYLHSNDFNAQVIRGYERIPGFIHGQVTKSIRQYYNRTPTRRSKIGLDNYAVWNAITNDPTIIQTENLNPIHNLKEKESITFTGVSGRKKDTMTRPTRVFLDTDKGVISDATKDSSDVGIEAVMVASPKIKDYYGFTERFDDDKDNAASLLSTTALLYPYADCDDYINSVQL